jgi:thiamine phosphate synthase YjbQ (UPF0047 family)
MPGILAAVAGELNGTQATLWLRGLEGLRRSWEIAGDTTSAAEVETRLGPLGNAATPGFVVARLVAGRQELGALSIKAGRELSPEDDLFVSAVADLLAPTLRDAEYAHHLRWGDDNGSSHVRAAMLGPSLTVPVVGSRLVLGTWQQIVLVEFDTSPRERQIVVQMLGETADAPGR